MNKQEFLSALQNALAGLPKKDRQKTLAFYSEMIDDRMEDGMTEEEAVAIALAHAGLTEEQVTRLRVEKDIDRGITLYEIDFDYGGYEYEYEIRVSDGKILKQELDWDD